MKIDYILLMLVCMSLLVACKGDKQAIQASSEAAADIAPEKIQDALKQAEQVIKDQGAQQTEPVNFRELQAFLPESMDGFQRSNLSGETSGAMGISISKVEAKYKNSEGKSIRIEIMDTGGLGMTQMSMAAWASIKVDKEDEKGYERSSEFGGYKSLEKFRKQGGNCELSLLVGSRFLVNSYCRSCEMDDLKGLVNSLDLKNLSSLN